MFVRGEKYPKEELYSRFGGSKRKGICTPANFPFIFIFTSEYGGKYGYEDGWQQNGIYNYTGEGVEGNQKFERGNRAIRDHIENGKDIFLFAGTEQVQFIGQMVCVGYHTDKRNDQKGNIRVVIVFELSPVELFNDQISIGNDLSVDAPLHTLREKAIMTASNNVSVSDKLIRIRIRSKAIRLYVLKRADGICELCEITAPFITKDGQLYLEAHHVRRLSDGGPDHPEYVAAICPNCHRRAHYGHDAQIINDKLSKMIIAKERIIKNSKCLN